MKKFNCITLFVLLAIPAFAQKIVPAIKTGTTISYAFKIHDQQSALELVVKTSNDTVTLNWRLRGLPGGSYTIVPAAFQNGDKLSFTQPAKGVVLPADQTFGMISKQAFNNLIKNHSYVYDNTTFDVKDDVVQNPVMLGDQQLDVIHAVARDETTEMWILNNPAFPLICKLKGNPLGFDFIVNSIK